MPGRDEMPSTLRKSGSKAQRTWVKAHDNAVREYGEGERAHRTAWAALKHTHRKSGDRWVPIDGRRGGPTRQELYEHARRLGIPGRSRMDKAALARAVGDHDEKRKGSSR
jgi:cation transport regulator ChaB